MTNQIHKIKLPYLDLIRAVSCIAIVLFHYSYNFFEYGIPGRGPGFLRFANGDFGGVFVAVFFMISGASIWYNHSRAMNFKELLTFWKKRWLSLFPAFYIAWIIMYVINSRKLGIWNWGGPRKNYLFTLFGMDGYFSHLGQNYYCLGEWFLGAIVWLYLLYPLLAWAFRNFRIPSTLILTFFYVFNLYRNAFSSSPDVNIFIVLIKYYNSHIRISDNMCLWTCIMNFWLGMLFITYREKLINKYTSAAGFALSALLLITELPIPKIIACTIVAFSIMLILAYDERYFCDNRIIKLISKYSYGIFLVHHVLIYAIMENFKTVHFNFISSMLLFIAVFTIITIVGAGLIKFTDMLIKFISKRIIKD